MKFDYSPLVLVLAQVVFTPISAITRKRAELQEAFRLLGYPLPKEHQEQQIQLQEAGIELNLSQMLECATINQHRSILIDEQSLVLQESEYQRFAAFSPQLLQALQTLQETVKGDLYIRRIGLRYIDWIPPEDGFSPEQLIHPGIGVFQPEGLPESFQSVQQFMMMTTSKSLMNLRVIRGQFEEVLPTELIRFAPKMKRPPQPDQRSVLLDFDHILDFGEDPLHFDPATLPELLREHQKYHSQAFKGSLSSTALQKWGYQE